MTTLNTDLLRNISAGQVTHLTVHNVEKSSNKQIFWRRFFVELGKQPGLTKLTLSDPDKKFCAKIAPALTGENLLDTLCLHKVGHKAAKEVAKIPLSSRFVHLELSKPPSDSIEDLSPLFELSLTSLTVRKISKKAINFLIPLIEESSIENLCLENLSTEKAELFSPLLCRSRKIASLSTKGIEEVFIEKLIKLKAHPLTITGEFSDELTKKIDEFNHLFSYPPLPQIPWDIPSPRSPYKAPKRAREAELVERPSKKQRVDPNS